MIGKARVKSSRVLKYRPMSRKDRANGVAYFVSQKGMKRMAAHIVSRLVGAIPAISVGEI